jgi:hypothetical protein
MKFNISAWSVGTSIDETSIMGVAEASNSPISTFHQ